MATSPQKKRTKVAGKSTVLSSAVNGGSNTTRSKQQHNPILVIGTIVLLFAVLIGFSLVIKTQRVANCAKDSQLVRAYNDAVSSGVDASKYQTIIGQVRAKAAYKNDIVCQYIIFQSALRAGDQDTAIEAYALLKQLSDRGKTVPAGLLTGEEVKSLLEQFQYYEQNTSRTEGVG